MCNVQLPPFSSSPICVFIKNSSSSKYMRCNPLSCLVTVFIFTDMPRWHLMSVHTQYSHFIYGKGLIKSYVIIWHVTYFIRIHNPKVDAFVVKKEGWMFLLPVMGTWWQFTWMRHCRAGKTFECCRWRINAERHAVWVYLVKYKSMKFVLYFVDTGQIPFPFVIKGSLGYRLVIPRVWSDPTWGFSYATGTHARMVTKTSFVKVGMIQCLNYSNPFVRIKP